MTVVQLESLSYLEQMQLMQTVGIIVGPYGAGLTHVLFSKRQGLVEIHNGDSKETHFMTLALASRCPYIRVQGGKSRPNQDFELGAYGIRATVAAIDGLLN